jgi:hypothetical protein
MEPAQDNIRKRVCKACDRCRLKKSKCDGANPCSRCKADNAICVFGERKKSQDKVYPKGYVEMLEQQQAQLVAGLRELYARMQNGQGWPGQPLPTSHGGHPLTHDILERLDVLHLQTEGGQYYEGFEEDCGRMQQKLLEQGARLTHRRGSISSNSDHDHTSSPSSNGDPPTSRPLNRIPDPFALNNAPPTPPQLSPFPTQAQIAKTEPLSPQIFMNAGVLDPSALDRSSWIQETIMTDDMDSSLFNTYGTYNYPTAMISTDPMNTAGPMLAGWSDPEFEFSNLMGPPVRT